MTKIEQKKNLKKKLKKVAKWSSKWPAEIANLGENLPNSDKKSLPDAALERYSETPLLGDRFLSPPSPQNYAPSQAKRDFARFPPSPKKAPEWSL